MGDRQSDEAEEVREAFEQTPAERAMEQAKPLASLVPVFGGLITEVLDREKNDRREKRMRGLLELVNSRVANLGEKFRELSEEAETFLRSEDFEELFIETLDKVAEERDEQKRDLYANFLLGLVDSPGEVDTRFKLLKALRETTAQEIVVLKAVIQEPPTNSSLYMGSPGHVLADRTGLGRDVIKDAVDELNAKKLTSLESLNVTMSAAGAEDLRSSLTPLGQRFVDFVLTDPTE